MTFKRGFKSQCEKRSVELRKQLGLPPTSPLKARELAEHIGVKVWSMNDIEGLSDDDLLQLTVNDPDSWSAFTLRFDSKHLVVYNPIQSSARENSVCMHELAHIILGHQLHDANLSEDGHLVPSNYSQDQENEADWLAGTLLLPRPALLSVRKRRLSDAEIKEEFLVSDHMLLWRFRMTGVDHQMKHSKRAMRTT